MKKSNEEKTYATLKLGKTYKFAGYNWMACEVDNDRHVVVIQSHGVTHGAWPGYTMPQFGNGNYYSNSIDGKDISDYDDKMRALYDDIKDAEDKAAPYGEGLYLISVEKAEFKEWDNTGSGNYWQALKATAENAHSFRDANYFAWLGTADGSGALYVSSYASSNGYVDSNYGLNYDFVVAPAFNLDLSKVKIVGGEIVIRKPAKSVKNARNAKKEKIREFLDEIYKESEILPENFGDEIVAELEERFLEDGYEITKKNAIEEMLWCYMCKMQ